MTALKITLDSNGLSKIVIYVQTIWVNSRSKCSIPQPLFPILIKKFICQYFIWYDELMISDEYIKNEIFDLGSYFS